MTDEVNQKFLGSRAVPEKPELGPACAAHTMLDDSAAGLGLASK
jgi:hypothetical protein